MLKYLAAAPAGLAALATRMASELGVPPSQQLLDSLEKIVQEFLRVALIEPVAT